MSHLPSPHELTERLRRLEALMRMNADEAAEAAHLIGDSPAIAALRSTIRRVADTDLPVLITGQPGTGKHLVAQCLHYSGRRRNEPFVVVDCAAVTEAEVESDLFGHEEAVLGGSREVRPGKLELTCGGTFLLGEIGHLGLDAQAGLLRLLDERVVVRAGGPTPIESDVRLLAATSRDLAELVRQQRFREDLYFRLNVVTLHLPPLRDRPADVLPLAEHFLADFCRQAHRKAPEFSTAARKRLNEYAWPGNVRQLRNLMERLAYLLAGDHIEAEDLDFTLSPRGKSPQPGDLSQPLAAATAQFQTEYIRRMIEASEGRMSRAAERLGLHRSNLYRKMGQLGMEPPADSK